MMTITLKMWMLFLGCVALMVAPGLGLDDQAADAPWFGFDGEAESPWSGSDDEADQGPSSSPRVIDLGTVPTHDQDLPPEPSPGFYDYLENCTAKVSAECGLEIVDALVKKTEAVSNECCQRLIGMGKDCHEALVKTIASIEEFKSFASVLPQRGSEVWNYCAHVAAAAAAPTPSSN